MPSTKSSGAKRKSRGISAGYRSGLEEVLADQIAKNGIDVSYETFKIPYTEPEVIRKYTPDYALPNGIIIESKGRFVAADRKKHLHIKQQHPEADIRFVFSNSRAKLNKGSKTTYADWCQKHGYQFSDKLIPDDWFNEPVNDNSLQFIYRMKKCSNSTKTKTARSSK